MKLTKVTITGADTRTPITSLEELSSKYPWVEWGILLSAQRIGENRFPTLPWLCNLREAANRTSLQLSGHLCGSWAKQVVMGQWMFGKEIDNCHRIFNRFQLNLGGLITKVGDDCFEALAHYQSVKPVQYIFQTNTLEAKVVSLAKERGVNAVALFDKSGGRGTLPTKWPVNNTDFCGYAGGLNPDNVEEQLQSIASVVDDRPIWIDVETGVRTNDEFDLQKVIVFLEKCSRFVSK